ncbi:hypothetical protein PVK37_12460 [Micromonospora cathayae]|uniref:Uncharacterized protein n=1 Tax=Micromonospora cathayae TaxID=3028804 RepID=A0ABY7ZYY4_9ACTN|nr:hypothetical protein [Micromonospora sp. HUAS 3]WDZ88036.1 hypothetical protein PVK37_12460 [Micromonospora sp. HUAS 3]
MVGRLCAGLALAAAALLGTAAPATAHGADAPNGTDYRSAVTGLAPARPGLSVRVVEAGARLELRNDTDRTVTVLGYSGEPYLQVRPDGVYENTRSPATYLNRTLAGETTVPAEADPTAEPAWQRIADRPVARWHDQRALWRESAPPPQVTAAPDREHRVRGWVVPLRDGDTPVELRGTLDWVPPPDAYLWWVAVALGALAVSGLGLVPAGRAAGGRALAVLGGLLATGGLAAVAVAVGRALDAGAQGPGELLGGLLTGQLWALITGLGAVAAGAWAVARRAAADFALALAGACLALFAGVTNAAVLARSVPPLPWPATPARLVVTLILLVGAGAVLAGVFRLHAESRATASRATPNPGSPATGHAESPATAPIEGPAGTAAAPDGRAGGSVSGGR